MLTLYWKQPDNLKLTSNLYLIIYITMKTYNDIIDAFCEVIEKLEDMSACARELNNMELVKQIEDTIKEAQLIQYCEDK